MTGCNTVNKIVSKECGWYHAVPKLSEEAKAVVRREVKVELAYNDESNKRECLD